MQTVTRCAQRCPTNCTCTDYLQSYDWDAIAKACGSTKGACSKRWSRLKLAFERGDAPLSTPSKAKSAPATPQKTPGKVASKKNAAGTPTDTPKRKRAAAKKTTDFVGDEEEIATPKRAKGTPKAKPRPKNAFRASDEKEAQEKETLIKGEPAEEGDVFVDAPEEICKFAPAPYVSLHHSHKTNGANVLSAYLGLRGSVHACEGDG